MNLRNHLAIATALVAFLFAATEKVSAKHDIPIRFEQKLYQFKLKAKGLKQFPATFRVDVVLTPDTKKAKNLFTKEVLRDAVTPDLLAAKKFIDAELEAFDKAVLEALKAGVITEKELDGRVAAVNAVYAAFIAELTERAKKQVRDEWKKMQQENTEYSHWKIDIGAKLLTDTVLLTRAGVSVAGSGGVTLGVEIVAIVNHSYKIAQNLKKALASEKSARKDLAKAIKAVESKLSSGGSKTGSFHALTGGSEKTLESKLDTYRKKWIAVRQSIESLSVTLDDVLASGEALKEVPKSEHAREEIEKSVKQLLAVIDKKNANRKAGEDLMVKGYEVVEIAKQKRLHTKVGNAEWGRRALAAFSKACDAALLVLDTEDEVIDKAIGEGIKAGATVLKELKKLPLKKLG